MPRKKIVERKTQIFELQGDVKVTIEFPAGGVRWQATHNAVSIATGDADMAALSPKHGQIVQPSTSEPVSREYDTPEILAAKAKLPDVLGGARKFARGSSEEQFAALGIELAPGELTPEALEAAESFGNPGGTVV